MLSLRSDITRKLLDYLFLNPQEALYVNELCRKLKVDKRNLVKKLKELEQEGILKSDKRGNLKLYSINKNHPLYEEYRRIIFKTVGLEDKLKRILAGVGGIREAYLYGSYAKNKMDSYSDIDLLVVGSHSIVGLQSKLSKLQREINREINVMNMGDGEFGKRVKSKDPFISGILEGKHIRIEL